MPTGACGINCNACGLNARGICSTCGSGQSTEGRRKMEAQIRLLGRPCPFLACAIENGIGYCSCDCALFPCDSFKAGPYPYSQSYLAMQERRRGEGNVTKTPTGDDIEIPVQYWEDLEKKDKVILCENSGAKDYPPQGLLLPFLKVFPYLVRNICLWCTDK